jgi:hypothetical protein
MQSRDTKVLEVDQTHTLCLSAEDPKSAQAAKRGRIKKMQGRREQPGEQQKCDQGQRRAPRFTSGRATRGIGRHVMAARFPNGRQHDAERTRDQECQDAADHRKPAAPAMLAIFMTIPLLWTGLHVTGASAAP